MRRGPVNFLLNGAGAGRCMPACGAQLNFFRDYAAQANGVSRGRDGSTFSAPWSLRRSLKRFRLMDGGSIS